MVLITGGTGVSGGAIVEALARTGKAFSVMVRDPGKESAAAAGRLGARIVRGDFSDPGSLERCRAGAAQFGADTGFGGIADESDPGCQAGASGAGGEVFGGGGGFGPDGGAGAVHRAASGGGS